MAGRRFCVFVAGVLLTAAQPLSGAGAPARDDVAGLLRHADDIKTADNPAFLDILRQLDEQAGAMSPRDRHWLEYLEGWQLGYSGQYDKAATALEAVVAAAGDDVTLRFRAEISLVNDEVFVGRYEDAYARLEKLLEQQPQIVDKDTRILVFGVAAALYNEAGQHDLAITYAERWLAAAGGDAVACKAGALKLDALFRSARLEVDAPLAQDAIDACTRAGEPLIANVIRGFIARIELAQGREADAIKLLSANDAELQRAKFDRAGSQFHSTLARAYLAAGDRAKARKYALSALDKSSSDEATKALAEAYDVLSRVAEGEGDYRLALEYHEKYAVADKRYLDDTTARAMAYQRVSQQVQEKKHQVDALNERNQLLRLQQQILEKSEEAARLYILLLLLVIGFVALWTYRIKRSQIRFQRLARRDGLTGIVNRQHFMDEAKAMLQACVRSSRVVCLILVDLDNFKQVNDTHGHVAGDGVLRQTVEMFQLHMRSDDLFGRLGGEEFGILMLDCSLETGLHRAEELRTAIAGFIHAGVEVAVSASFGVTSTVESGYELRQLLIHADSALYGAKRKGRDRVERFDQETSVAPAIGQLPVWDGPN